MIVEREKCDSLYKDGKRLNIEEGWRQLEDAKILSIRPVYRASIHFLFIPTSTVSNSQINIF